MSRKNVHLSDSVETKAGELIKSGVADGLSDLIARLIREEWDRRHGTYPIRLPIGDHLNEDAPPPANSGKSRVEKLGESEVDKKLATIKTRPPK